MGSKLQLQGWSRGRTVVSQTEIKCIFKGIFLSIADPWFLVSASHICDLWAGLWACCFRTEFSPCRYVCLEGSSAPCPSDGIHGYRCPSGFYCPAGTGVELPCEPGSFSPMPGASVCLPCPAGMACSSAATVEPLSCPRGKQYMSAAKPLSCNQNNHANIFLPAHSSGSPQGMPYLPIIRARSAFPLPPFFSEQYFIHLSTHRLLLSSRDCCSPALPRGDAERLGGGPGPRCL